MAPARINLCFARTALGKVLTAFRAEVPWSGVGVPVARTAHTLRDPGEIRHVLARARREGVAYDREEADLGVRARRAGWDVGLVRGALVDTGYRTIAFPFAEAAARSAVWWKWRLGPPKVSAS